MKTGKAIMSSILKNFGVAELSNHPGRYLKKRSLSIIDKLEFCFYPADKTKNEEVTEFYNDEYDSLSLTGELQLVHKWEKLISEKIKRN